jgi:hypothetical protein
LQSIVIIVSSTEKNQMFFQLHCVTTNNN